MLILKKIRETGLHASLSSKKGTVYTGIYQVLFDFDKYGLRYIKNSYLCILDVVRSRLRNEAVFTLEPSAIALYASLFFNLRYLCWSVPNNKLKYLVWLVFVNFCYRIIVNDSYTLSEVKNVLLFAKNRVKFVYFGIDTDYFACAPNLGSYVLVPGDAFRDEEYLEWLVRNSNFRFCRLTRRNDIAERWIKLRKEFPERIELAYRVPHQELPKIYSYAAVTLLPIVKMNEPAGLTCLLESLSCGVVVVTNSKKTGHDYLQEVNIGKVVSSKNEIIHALEFYHDEGNQNSDQIRSFAEKFSWDTVKKSLYSALK